MNVCIHGIRNCEEGEVKSSRNTVAAWGAITVGIATFSIALAVSNTGFKITAHLLKADGGVNSNSGTNYLALPYQRKAGLNDAKSLMDDIGFASVLNVSRYIRSSDSFTTYTGRKGSAPNFPLVSGEGYCIRVINNVDYVVDGSHANNQSVMLYRAGEGPPGDLSFQGYNVYAPPYHATAQTAYALMSDIGFASVNSVSRFMRATDSFQTYTGRKGSSPNFPITRGDAYYVKMLTTVNYVPSHY